MIRMILIIVTLLALSVFPGFAQDDLSQLLPSKYWIFFDSKETPALAKSSETAALCRISARALQRRQKVPSANIIDPCDWPLNQSYLTELKHRGILPIVESRWLNAISANLTPVQTNEIKSLPFIRKLVPVQRYVRKKPVDFSEPVQSFRKSRDYTLDYGLSLNQNEIMAVPEVHDLGINGEGVLVLMLDTGYNHKNHVALAQLDVAAEFDFIYNDSITANQDEQDPLSQHEHGTETLATIGGFYPGELIGPAYGARFLLAKTEYVGSETIIEEDYWVKGLEWGENEGADIASSSLGYDDWYKYEDFDGNTAITTIAADIAAKKGMVVINSMGNEGNFPGSIIAPADGDSVISVGAVTPQNMLASFSSVGPTWDDRTKPDVVAQGSSVRTVSPNSGSAYLYSNGTSFSCPLAAGVAALILTARPELTPMEVRDALRLTADRANSPDNKYGWGLVNALGAVLFYGPAFSTHPVIEHIIPGFKTVKIKARSKFGIDPEKIRIHIRKIDGSFESKPMARTETNFEYEVTFPMDGYGETIGYYFSVEDSIGAVRKHPYNAPNQLFETDGAEFGPAPTRKFILYQNFPNPFHSLTQIRFHLPEKCRVNVSIYTLNQRLVKTLVNGERNEGNNSVFWDGSNRFGQTVASGTYQLLMTAKGFSAGKLIEFIQLDLLKQNHPNPFNQSTAISYKLPNPGKVTLKIFNVQGQLVDLLVDEKQEAGDYQIHWQGVNFEEKILPSGIYFYVLTLDGMYYIKKLTLIR